MAADMSSSLKNLPAGFRLNPRDDDLINFFLIQKLQGILDDTHANCFIPVLDVYLYHPQDLIALYDEMACIKSNGLECFFFCTLGKDPNRRCNSRKIAEGKKGFWHRTGEGRPAQATDKLKWAKRIFSHRVGTHRDFVQTDWVMHEFRLISDESLVLCRITKKKPKKKSSVSAGNKRKGGSTDDNESHQDTIPDESHQETSIESCVLNDIVAKKAKNHTGESFQQNNQFRQKGISSEASSSERNTTSIDTWIALLNMAETFTPDSDINLILKQI